MDFCSLEKEWHLGSIPSFIYSSVAGWICQFEQAKLWNWQQVGSKTGGGGPHAEIGRVEGDEKIKRLWQSSIWPRLLSESSLACQISVLTVNSHIFAEHGRVSCTMVSWFRIRLDEAIGWMTLRRKHFFSNSLSVFFPSFFPKHSLRMWKVWTLISINFACLCENYLSEKTPSWVFKERNPFLGPRLSLVSLNYWTMRIFLPHFFLFFLCTVITSSVTHIHTHMAYYWLISRNHGRITLQPDDNGKENWSFFCAGVRG